MTVTASLAVRVPRHYYERKIAAKRKTRKHKELGARKRQSPEFKFHLAALEYLRMALPREAVLTHFPAGGPDAAWRKKCATMGVQNGMPDFLLFWKGSTYGIELKSPKGQLSKAQRDCRMRLLTVGVPVAVSRNLADLEHTLRIIWSIPLRAKVGA